MTRAVRLSAAMLLAGLGLVVLPGTGWAQNTPWQFSNRVDPLTDKASATVLTVHAGGAFVSFTCVRGDDRNRFLAFGSTKESDRHPSGSVEIAWRIDSEQALRQSWESNTLVGNGGVVAIGAQAYEFALGVAKAQNRVVFSNSNGTVVFNAHGSTNAIRQLLSFCEIE